MDKENFYQAFLNQPPLSDGETYVTRAANPVLLFNRNLLDNLDKNPELNRKVYEEEGLIEYMSNRDRNGLNIDCHRTHLIVAISELEKQDRQILPWFVGMQSKKPFLTRRLRGGFAGYTEGKFRYEQPLDNGKGRLENQVRITHIPSRVSPIVETISVERIVNDNAIIRGDICSGSVILQDKQVARDLGLPSDNDHPAFLNFIPGKVIAVTYGEIVLRELTYAEVEKVGINAHFTDTPEAATLALAAGNLSFKLWVNKSVKPDWPALLFGKEEEWITDSGILVSTVPTERQN